ncbi:BRCA1-associated RING domain protein 1 isoform X3 [Petromyzon marinus]|uniref:BRCA1-associated RING domain protein 1 isoform X3 n=1 Tax=Petromyzon marinus TaxID=7757 RepID=UPI003F70D72A
MMESTIISWGATAGALVHLEELLGCALWLCVSDHVGNSCPICQAPSWVRDLQANRQLAGMVTLCRQLRELLATDTPPSDKACSLSLQQPGPREKDIKPSPEIIKTPELTKKANVVSMQFSPRSGQVRCHIKKPTRPLEDKENAKTSAADGSYASVYDFQSSQSSPDQTLIHPPQPRRLKTVRKRLSAINKSWGFGKKRKKNTSESTDVASKIEVVQKDPADNRLISFGPEQVFLIDSSNVTCSAVSGSATPSPDANSAVAAGSTIFQSLWSPTMSGESVESNPSGRNSESEKTTTDSALGAMSKRALERPSGASPSKKAKSCWNGSILQKSPPGVGGRRKAEGSVAGSPGTSEVLKKNRKGETPLHVAAIKGDIDGVEHLLENGANPNIKDNAGWTPLHEACNHGHARVVELLLDHGAFINAPGYENDSPLHDAVSNGHTHVAGLLVGRGADQHALNMLGLKPLDYANSEEMRMVFTSQPFEPSTPTFSLPASLPSGPIGPMVLLDSRLSEHQKESLKRVATTLGGRVVSTFNNSATHVIVDSTMQIPRTMKCFLAILNGCWIIGFQWVQACLARHERVPEQDFEVRGRDGSLPCRGPERGRLNKLQQLPGLFDGCYFFLGGPFDEPSRFDLSEMVRVGGGRMLSRQPKADSDVTQSVRRAAYHARRHSDQEFCTHYVVYDGAWLGGLSGVSRLGKVWTVPSGWLVECVLAFELLPFDV